MLQSAIMVTERADMALNALVACHQMSFTSNYFCKRGVFLMFFVRYCMQ
jgi:hypothetical protein